MELFRMYSLTLGKDQIANVTGFLNWQAESESPTLRFIVELTLNIALSIYVERVGDRNNDPVCSDAGRYKFYKLFYGFNHPIYREVEYNELRQKAIYPEKIALLRNDNVSFSSAKKPSSNHEGGDFKLENRIKQIKSITPKEKKDVGKNHPSHAKYFESLTTWKANAES